jgi:hypothetical protein
MEMIMVTEVALHYKQNKNKVSNSRMKIYIIMACISKRILG